MKSFWNVFIGLLVGAVVGFVVGVKVQGGGAPPRPAPPPQQAEATKPAQRPAEPPPGSQTIYKAFLGAAPVKGNPEAKVTIVEFSDFQCPYCARALDTVRQIERAYGREVRIAFKQLPLPMHPDAPLAARASLAAEKQGKFWEMHDKLFEANLSQKPDALKRPRIEQMARELGLDLERFKADIEGSDVKDLIESDQAQARTLGVNGTPHFFVNGAQIVGAQPFENFKQIIDAQMKRADEALAKGVPRKELYDSLIKDGQLAPPPPQAPPQPPSARNIDPGQGPAKGAKFAKVTIVEFSDFQCPFCARVRPTLEKIFETYKGDVRLVWRNQPLPFHPNAMPAAKAAMAAHKLGKFWAMHDLMFERQGELSDAKYEEWAKQIGLDVRKFRKDKDSAEIESWISKDMSYGQEVGADGTPTFFINGRLISGALPFDSFKAVIDEQIAKAKDLLQKGVKPEKLYETIVSENVKAVGGPRADATPSPLPSPAPPVEAPAKIELGGAPLLGPKSAPVTIVEFSDFQCPFCGRVEPTLQKLRDEYKGKIRFAWKNQPLPFHPNAMPAAEAAMAAHEQGKFWEMHDRLFERQAQLSPQLYDEIAKEIGLDLDKFHAAIESHKFAGQIQADAAAGNALGASGTPTFFVNGRKVVGAAPIETFRQAIEAELSGAIAKN